MSKTIDDVKAAILDAMHNDASFDSEGTAQLANAYATLVDASYREMRHELERSQLTATATARSAVKP